MLKGKLEAVDPQITHLPTIIMQIKCCIKKPIGKKELLTSIRVTTDDTHNIWH